MSRPSDNLRGIDDFDFKSFFLDIPPVTRTLFIATFSFTLLSVLGLLPISPFVLDWTSIITRFQIWRLVLSFFHAGRRGLPFLIRMYFLFTYSKQLEVGTFFGRPANYAWFLTLVAIFAMLFAPLFLPTIHGGAVLLAIMHLWGRHADGLTISLYGFIQIPAKYLSLTMLVLDVIINGSIDMSDALGLVGGHLYYFLDSVYPFMPQGRQLIFVPIWYERFIDNFQNILGSVTGLQRGPPVPPTRGFTPVGGSSTVSAVHGRPNRGAATSGARPGFTAPSLRQGHVWGQGNVLGSS